MPGCEATTRVCRRFAWWWCWLVVVIASRAETLTIATYNVQNYGPANRLTDVGYRQDYPKPEAEKRALRQVIRTINADLLVLQEMGPLPYLEELRRDLRSEGLDYPYLALAEAADPDRHVAVLSRRRLVRSITHTELEFAYFGAAERVKRGLLEVAVATDAGELTVFALHLKSRFTDRADDPLSALRRTGEATAIRDAVLRRFPDPPSARFVILGDCNDSPVSKPVERLLRRGSTAIAVLLPVADSKGETWTYFYRKEDVYSRVDHLLLSLALQRAVRGGVGRVFDGPGVRQASDHRPVLVELDLNRQ